MKIAIAGYGLEGESSFRYYSKDPSNDITIADQKQPERELPKGVNTIISEDAFARLNSFDLVIRTAGLMPRKIFTDGKIWSSTNEFFDKCPAPIIGVTGSKGKGTTASLIASILRAAGKTIWLVGNIGEAPLDKLGQIAPDDIVVFELSSFQLIDIVKSPHVAVVLFIEQEHLDVHADMEEYVNAKANIAKFQSDADILVYNVNNEYSKRISLSGQAVKIPYPDNSKAHIQDGWFYYGDQKICSIDVMKIPGRHNLDNACAAIDAVWNFVNEPRAIEQGLSEFTGLQHRLKFVREVSGVKYYDDSIATTPSAAIAALRAFNQPKIIILGGSYKGSDFTELAHELIAQEAKAILIGDEAKTIAATCDREGFKNYEIIEDATMELVVKRASELAQPGDVVLLSPSAASFGLFKNYADRGDQYITAVNNL